MANKFRAKCLRLSLVTLLGALLLISPSIAGVSNASAAKFTDTGFTLLSATPKVVRWQGGHLTLHIVIAKGHYSWQDVPKGCQITSQGDGGALVNLKVLKGPRPNHSKGLDTTTWAFAKCPTVVTFVVPPDNLPDVVSEHVKGVFDFFIEPLKSQVNSPYGFYGDIVVTQAAPPRPPATTTTLPASATSTVPST